jgi:peptidylprolyl isomerase
MRGTRIPALVLTAAVAVATAACGSSTPTTSPSTTAKAPVGTSPSTTFAPVSQPSPAGTFGVKPSVTVPTGRPPTHLEVSDLITGTGAVAKKGDTVTVQYVGVAYSTEQQFDASWDRNMPFTFVLGVGDVIKGWDEGVVGMRVGGRRELVIPPALGYGAESPSPAIPANETLIFVVDLLSIGPATTTTVPATSATTGAAT